MKISTHCFIISGLSVEPPWAVNSGFVLGSHTTMVVDTGSNYLSAQTIFGYSHNIKPENRLIVVNSEPHFDHIGGNGFFKEKEINIFAHPGFQRDPADFEQNKKDFNDTIPNAVRKANNETEVFFYKTELVNPNKKVSQGDEIDLGSLKVKVFETPGHTPFNLSFFVEEDKALYCGDCIVTGYIPNLEVGKVEDWHIWLKSIEKIENLEPEIIIPGHGDYIQGKNNVSQELNRMRAILNTAIQESKPPTL